MNNLENNLETRIRRFELSARQRVLAGELGRLQHEQTNAEVRVQQGEAAIRALQEKIAAEPVTIRAMIQKFRDELANAAELTGAGDIADSTPAMRAGLAGWRAVEIEWPNRRTTLQKIIAAHESAVAQAKREAEELLPQITEMEKQLAKVMRELEKLGPAPDPMVTA
jgi:DNA repair exonuclease SbcCD ATPase subunit